MKRGVVINQPTYEDIDTLWRWGEENWELWADEKGRWFSKDNLRAWLDEPEDDVLLIARQGKKPVGMCITATLRNWGVCWGLFVEESYRGRGIGKQLLDETKKRLKELGARDLILLVDIKNDRARKFYLREGFRQGYGFYMMTAKLKGKNA